MRAPCRLIGDYQRETPAILAAELTEGGFSMRVVVADPYGLGRSSSCRIDHADTGETSLSLELIPQLVRLERKIGPDIYSGKKPFANTRPTREGGRELREAYFTDAQALINAEYASLETAEQSHAPVADKPRR